jgi:hypothetical protein
MPQLSVAELEAENARLRRELAEAFEQQAATSEVLRVISSSPGNLKPVFQAMLENATRVCEAKFGILWLREGDGFRSVALHNLPPAYAEQRQREPGLSIALSLKLDTKNRSSEDRSGFVDYRFTSFSIPW